jgi:hypothetical protein
MAETPEWGVSRYTVLTDSGSPSIIAVSGRDRWALEQLIKAGHEGCTPVKDPAPRWSGYVFNLRALGVPIETVNEPHQGPFPGTHARYVLRATVTRHRQEAAE